MGPNEEPVAAAAKQPTLGEQAKESETRPADSSCVTNADFKAISRDKSSSPEVTEPAQ